jgi:anti-sigma regulatory factor (Ser/Thr protein kinase)
MHLAGAIMTSSNDHLYWLLNPDRSAASQARALTWEALARLGLEAGLIDDGVAIVGELVANAIVHGFPPVELQLQPGSREVKLLVVDHELRVPIWTSPGSESLSGRGLFVVSAYSGGNCGTASAPYRSIANMEGKAVWAVLPRRPGQLADLEPASAASLLQRWLARRGLRGVVSRANGHVCVVSVAAGCTIWCLPEKLVWRAEGEKRFFAYPQLADLVDHLCAWSSVARTAPGARHRSALQFLRGCRNLCGDAVT